MPEERVTTGIVTLNVSGEDWKTNYPLTSMKSLKLIQLEKFALFFNPFLQHIETLFKKNILKICRLRIST